MTEELGGRDKGREEESKEYKERTQWRRTIWNQGKEKTPRNYRNVKGVHEMGGWRKKTQER